MPGLFESTTINGMTMANRFIRSGTWTGMATEDGFMTPKLKDLIVNVARGGVGALIPDYAPVLKNGQSAARQLSVHNDAQIPGLADLVDAVHGAGARIVLQLVHGGAHSKTEYSGEQPMGPSAMAPAEGKFGPFDGCREMNQSDIDDVVKGFAAAAARARKAGFDGVQIHCAHGYLFSQFLSPFYNKRDDSYGGSLENRVRIVAQAYEQVRKTVGADYPILVKMNVTDFLDDGISNEDAYQAAKMYAGMGIDAIELSGGTSWGGLILGDFNKGPMQFKREEGYYREMGRRLKGALDVPIILTGGIRKYETAQSFLDDGTADYIGLCRPLIREPGLINRWKSGDTAESGCISDNGCTFAAASGKDLQCVKVAQQQ
jgi:2,4-dienoyl-CoA reductase-like NADH-dependent reductase (Old Yellow Enzyme family)